MGVPQELDGWFHGKSQSKSDWCVGKNHGKTLFSRNIFKEFWDVPPMSRMCDQPCLGPTCCPKDETLTILDTMPPKTNVVWEILGWFVSPFNSQKVRVLKIEPASFMIESIIFKGKVTFFHGNSTYSTNHCQSPSRRHTLSIIFDGKSLVIHHSFLRESPASLVKSPFFFCPGLTHLWCCSRSNGRPSWTWL